MKKTKDSAKKNKKNNIPNKSSVENSFYVVGLGASAGGLDALERFFKNMPNNSGMAFIVVTHLDPDHVSIMPELVQKATSMKLFQAEDGMKVQPNNVYVTPANREIALLHGTIQLIEPIDSHGFRLPIDFFFKSIAADLGEKAIGIILSGMASDGTAGLRDIKSGLGMVMVQEPKTAKFDGMPLSAIKTRLADFILPPEEMPEQLIKYTTQKIKGVLFNKFVTEEKIPDSFQKIFIILRTHTGHDFSQYKQNTIYRRVERRMNVAQLEDIPNYIRLLQENPDEVEKLFKELLIGVTNFFRDPDSFEKLKIILEDIIKEKPDNAQLRIWVPGCSTGEEAYSIAILTHECLSKNKKYLNVQIFATDIDSNAIEKARIGSYTSIEGDVSKERLKRYFTKEGNHYYIQKEIREMVVFAPQSIIKDPPFTKLDLISCRNLLIYLNVELQKKVIPLFHYSLVPNGKLFLGSSETINGYVDLFTMVDKKWKIYKRRDSHHSAQPLIEFPISRNFVKTHITNLQNYLHKNISQIAEKLILESYSANCVITSENGDIIYIHGRTGKYLELINGEAKMNIFEMAREGLQQELSVLSRKVLTTKKPARADGIKIKNNGTSSYLNLIIKPIIDKEEIPDSLLIIFEEVIQPKKTQLSQKISSDKRSEKIIKELERELKSTKENLRSTIEELKTSNEELKSINEEMQSTNEEMLSSNEELETSKEELQSLNEELITVNTELQNKNDELSIINNDMKNLMDSTNTPTIFLDNNLLIKRFTSDATKVVNLIASDIGRPINHIATNLRYDQFIEDAHEVLKTLIFKEIEVQTNEGIWYQMRIMPYRTINNIIDGVVVTFTNINNLKTAYEEVEKLNKELQFSRQYADNIVNTVRESLLILDENLLIVSANTSFYKLFNTTEEKTVGKYLYNLSNKNWDIPKLCELLEQIIPQQQYFENYEIEYDFNEDGKRKLVLNARQIINKDKDSKLILLVIQSE
jgi:two-component system CheB/CheR fusion protein